MIAQILAAVAGMNAHINRDLPAAIVECYQELGGVPSESDARHEDFDRINALLERSPPRRCPRRR